MSVASVARRDFANWMAFTNSSGVEISNVVAFPSSTEPSELSLICTVEVDVLNKS